MKLKPPSPSELGDRIRETEVWKSIFRPGSIFRKGYKDTSRDRALATMNNVLYHLHPVKVKRHGLKLTYTFCLGGLSFFLFILLTITGIFLMFFYRPMADIGGAQAYTDMQNIRTSVFFGDLVRNLHRWGAHLMVFTVTLHMARVFYTGAYKPPREFNWVVGVILLFLTLGLSFTGYLLPWDQLAIWAVTVGTSLAGYSPFIAKQANFLLLGGVVVGPRDPAPVVRAPRARAAVRVGDLPGGPLLADPQGRRHLGTALGAEGEEDMAKEDTPLDQGVFDSTLEAELAKGTDRRVAEGRARSAAVRAFRAAQPGGGGQARRRAARRPPTAPQRPLPPQPPRPRPPQPPAAAGAPAGAVAVAASAVTVPAREAPLPTGNLPTPKKGAPDKHRLLALVPPEGIQRVEREQGDRVNVWPHLLIEEFVAMFILLAALTIFSTFINAPLRELANANLTPNPSKAPWYFLGLQELLRYFHPMVAGITIPTFILVGLAAIPYVDRNPSIKPGDRQDRDHAVHDPVHVRRDAHDHRLVLPRPRVQLDLAVGAGGVLRTVSTLALSTGRLGGI